MQIIEVTDLAVRSAVLRLRRSGTPMEFVVYPMIHMGSAGFYREVRERLRSADIVVAEGIKPGASRLGSVLGAALVLSYRVLRFNRRARVVEQDIDYDELDVPVVNPDVDADEFRAGWRQIRRGHRILLWLVLPFVMLARLFGGTRVIWSREAEVNDLPSVEDETLAESAPEVVDAFAGERDHRLLAALVQLHEQRATDPIEVAVVYGASHVPAIVHGLREHGYRPRFGDWLTVVDLDRSQPPVRTPPRQREPAPAREPATRREPATTREPATERKPTAERTPARTLQGPPTTPAPPRPEPADPEADVQRLRALAEQDPDRYLGRLASALMQLSDWLAEHGRSHEALAAADDAVDLCEELRERFGATYNQAAAWAAYTLGRRLRDIGHGEDATALFAEAVQIMRDTHRHDPYPRAQHLGAVLSDYGLHLLRQGRHEPALAAAMEAVELYRTANSEVPGELLRPWALAQRNVSLALGALGRHEEALAAAQRAVNLARGRSSTTLVDVLRTLTYAYRDLDRVEEALATARDCVEVARSGQDGQSTVDESLGWALDLMANTLYGAGEVEQAVEVAAEAVTAWRAAAASPRHRDGLTTALARYRFYQARFDQKRFDQERLDQERLDQEGFDQERSGASAGAPNAGPEPG